MQTLDKNDGNAFGRSHYRLFRQPVSRGGSVGVRTWPVFVFWTKTTNRGVEAAAAYGQLGKSRARCFFRADFLRRIINAYCRGTFEKLAVALGIVFVHDDKCPSLARPNNGDGNNSVFWDFAGTYRSVYPLVHGLVPTHSHRCSTHEIISRWSQLRRRSDISA